MTTNDPDHPTVMLACTGKLFMPLTLEPANVNFGQIAHTVGTQYQTVTITRGDAGPIAPEVTGGREAGVDAQVCEIEPGERYELVVSVGPPWPSGRFRDVLRVETGVEEAPEMILMVAGSVAPRVSAVPRISPFPQERPTETQRSVRLQRGGGGPANILEASTGVPDGTVRLEEQNKIQ